MINRIANVPCAIWVILMGLTLLSVAIMDGKLIGPVSTFVIVVIAAIKSRMVILHYMEAKHAAAPWRYLYEAWNFAAVATILIGQYMFVPS